MNADGLDVAQGHGAVWPASTVDVDMTGILRLTITANRTDAGNGGCLAEDLAYVGWGSAPYYPVK